MPTVHTIPINDSREHEESTSCPCCPRVDFVEGGMHVTHNSFDGREAVEEAEKVLGYPQED